MDVALLFQSRFLKSQEFKGKDVTLKIAGVHLEDLATEGPKVKGQAPTKRKGLVSFADTEKLWVMNRTNADCLKAMFGRDTDKWIGRRVTLYPAPFTNHLTGEVTTAIRVRGSPDISAPVAAVVALPLRKPITMRLLRTDAKGSAQLAAPDVAPEYEPPPALPPPSDPPPAPVAATQPENASPFAAHVLSTPSSKFVARAVGSVELADLAPAIAQLDAWLAAKPEAKWAPAAKADIAALRGELAYREAAIDAALGAAPEPGSEG